ncbi:MULTISPECIES: winged helix-turn-helix transcriptional regulator [unclassified Mesorhizobium]|uniref:winged helix-turn-helix transcriptional regulator n=1 Tax=unclassified Mesorhizobium TaxID=325217 RepID=UPI0003FF7114|nr:MULTISPECIES: winged helix-turn-helix transcriptional regulator [unclassified Mesorhizobium]WJI76716.1 winged helix-turn-helix transcriptional regulator [Mesorhizobium sp. C395A]
MYSLLLGPKRYGELKRAVAEASDNVLVQQLKELHRFSTEVLPPRSNPPSYRIT